MLSLYEILKASKTGIAPDMWTALAGLNWGGADSGAEVKELTGIPPLSFTADGTPLLDYLISGNMSQTDTPTPDNPIMPHGTGERTGNLYNINAKDVTNGYVDSAQLNQDGTTEVWGSAEISEYIPISGDTTYTFNGIGSYNSPCYALYDENKQLIGAHKYNGAQIINFTSPNNARYFRFTHIKIATRAMMVEGAYTASTMPDYEPYGIKTPISSGGENLFDDSTIEIGGLDINTGAEVANSSRRRSGFIKVTPSTAYTLTRVLDTSNKSNLWIIGYDANKNVISDSVGTRPTVLASIGENITLSSFDTTPSTEYIRWYVTANGSYSDIMLNLGSTPLPYEPYVQPTLSNIYLGEVETTRYVKQLVLTGEENWIYDSNGSRCYINITDAYAKYNRRTQCYCSHYICLYNGEPFNTIPNHSIYINLYNNAARFFIKNEEFTSAADFKSFLAQQYANGTPVTVWYVLATPETAVVNEPLRKIGDYADTVSYEQAGVQIPTLHGNTVIDVETTLKPSEVYIKYQE